MASMVSNQGTFQGQLIGAITTSSLSGIGADALSGLVISLKACNTQIFRGVTSQNIFSLDRPLARADAFVQIRYNVLTMNVCSAKIPKDPILAKIHQVFCDIFLECHKGERSFSEFDSVDLKRFCEEKTKADLRFYAIGSSIRYSTDLLQTTTKIEELIPKRFVVELQVSDPSRDLFFSRWFQIDTTEDHQSLSFTQGTKNNCPQSLLKVVSKFEQILERMLVTAIDSQEGMPNCCRSIVQFAKTHGLQFQQEVWAIDAT